MKLIFGLLLVLLLGSCGPLRVAYTAAPPAGARCPDGRPAVRLDPLTVLHYPTAVVAPVGFRVHNNSPHPVRVAPSLLRLTSSTRRYGLRHFTVTTARHTVADQPVVLPAGDSCVVVALFADEAVRGEATDAPASHVEEVVTLALREFAQQLGPMCGVDEYRWVPQPPAGAK